MAILFKEGLDVERVYSTMDNVFSYFEQVDSVHSEKDQNETVSSTSPLFFWTERIQANEIL